MSSSAQNQPLPIAQLDDHSKDNEDAGERGDRDDLVSFRFEQLPTEVQRQVVHHIASERELLEFRLVSSLANALVLDPGLWQEISFSKKRYFKTGHTSGSHRNTSPMSPYYHHSDAGIIIHRQSFAASMLERSSQHSIVEEAANHPSLHIGSNVPRTAHPSRPSLSEVPSAAGHSWTTIQDSFLAFMVRLSMQQRSAHRVRQVAIKDWVGNESITSLWRTLQTFDSIEELSIESSALQCLCSPIAQDSHSTIVASPWMRLNCLELKDCLDLRDISGILLLMPRLQKLSLEGCRELQDFSPLASPSETDNIQELFYTRVNLIDTTIRDQDLIKLLERSPRIQELRLDRCYHLTEASLVAMGYGHNDPAMTQEAFSSENQEHDTQPIQSQTSGSFCPNLKVLSIRDCYDLGEDGVRALAGCRQLEKLIIRGLRGVDERTIEWLHSQGVPLRAALGPLGHWRYWTY
ncbi:hypothetical protein B0O80DRAFT_496909 [Mortierella sp. GBAus27b]|nr:hypothetical protein BGX31_000736 [Mortierella sp. GBA43]KAI8357207.1 hypothetical protein B0O80DRAFT_496909 [Mortierella sp. GBAus27b]